MGRYSRIPVEVEALQWDGSNFDELRAMAEGKATIRRPESWPGEIIQVVDPTQMSFQAEAIRVGDWVVVVGPGVLVLSADEFEREYQEEDPAAVLLRRAQDADDLLRDAESVIFEGVRENALSVTGCDTWDELQEDADEVRARIQNHLGVETVDRSFPRLARAVRLEQALRGVAWHDSEGLCWCPGDIEQAVLGKPHTAKCIAAREALVSVSASPENKETTT